MLQIAGELHNHKVLDQLQRSFKARNMKEFYATAEKVLRVESGNPVVRSVIVGDQLISERDQVDQAIADYFQEVYGRDDHQADPEANMALWTRLEAVAEMALGMFTMQDVVEAMKASNFNKGLGPDGFDGAVLKPGDPPIRFT